MSKKRRKSDSKQLNLFNYLNSVRALDKKSSEGTLNIGTGIRRSLSEGIKQCPLSRHQIAGEMSHRIGVEVTVTTIDSWTAESKGKNRIPAEYIPAFCVVTGYFEPLNIIEEASGRFTLPGPDALRGEIRKWQEKTKKARAEVRKRELLLDELEARRM